MKGTQEKGITLIALVVTIIVLIILAGVSINLVLGDNGVITKSKEASEKQEIAGMVEKIRLDIAAKETEKVQNNSKLTKSEMEDILEKYGKINYEGTTIKSITTTKGNYEILYKDIYTGTLEVVTYTATFSGTKVTSNGANTVNEGETYTATLTIENGYEIDTLTVKMGGTELVENIGYTYTNSTITIPSVSGNIEIIVSGKIEGITASDIEADASYIGKYVNYGGQETFKGVKWRIYNAENGQIQLIADNYIKSDVMPTIEGIKKGTAEGAYSDYCVYPEEGRITLLNYINTTSNWSEFVAVTGATVTGGPTIEQFKNSYNRTHGPNSDADVKEIFIAKSEIMSDGLEGYYVGTIEDGTGYVKLNQTEMENLYIINNTTNAVGYWLGSVSAYYGLGTMIVYHQGDFEEGGSYWDTTTSLRPLVTLPSGITLIEQENGTYNIQ